MTAPTPAPQPKTLTEEFSDAIASSINGFQARGLPMREIVFSLEQTAKDCQGIAIEQFVRVAVSEQVGLLLDAERERARNLQEQARLALRNGEAHAEIPKS